MGLEVPTHSIRPEPTDAGRSRKLLSLPTGLPAPRPRAPPQCREWKKPRPAAGGTAGSRSRRPGSGRSGRAGTGGKAGLSGG
eukprot:298324-Heterocapsa_arctica.AAC.1